MRAQDLREGAGRERPRRVLGSWDWREEQGRDQAAASAQPPSAWR